MEKKIKELKEVVSALIQLTLEIGTLLAVILPTQTITYLHFPCKMKNTAKALVSLIASIIWLVIIVIGLIQLFF